jgi:hypothetical protein
MRALKGRIPRAFSSHAGADAHLYGRLVRAKKARLGQLPVDAEPTLKEWGQTAVDLDLLGREAGELRIELRRLEVRRRKLRVALSKLDERLEQLAGERKPLDLARAIAEAQARTPYPASRSVSSQASDSAGGLSDAGGAVPS